MQTAERMRERLFTMRMSDEEHARAERVAEHYALNVAGLIRMLIKREDDGLRAQKLPETHSESLEKRRGPAKRPRQAKKH